MNIQQVHWQAFVGVVAAAFLTGFTPAFNDAIGKMGVVSMPQLKAAVVSSAGVGVELAGSAAVAFFFPTFKQKKVA